MIQRRWFVLFVAVGLVLPWSALARQNIVSNGSLEVGAGQGAPNPFIAASWTEFGENVERSLEANLTSGGEAALKAFGDSVNPATGGYQELAAAPGDTVSASVWLYTRAGDKLGGTGQAGLRVEFCNVFGPISGASSEALVLDAGSEADTWIQASAGPITAPSGTTKVRVTCVLRYTLDSVSGAVFWDDATLTLEGAEPTPLPLLNPDFETPGISDDPNPQGIEGWTGFNDQQKSDEAAFHGTFSVKLGISEPYSGLVQEMGDLVAGDRIVLKARAMIPSSDPLDGNAMVGIKLEFSSSATVPPPEENLAFDENATTNAWVPVTISTVVPTAMTKARIVMIYVGDAETTGAVRFDSASATRNGGSNMLLNPSFEFGDGGVNGIADWSEFNTPGTSSAQKSCFVPGFTPLDGNCTMKATGQAVAGIYQEIDVVPGETLDVNAYLFTGGSAGEPLEGTGKAGVKVEWAAGNVPGNVDIGGPPNTILAGAATDVWHELYIDYTMPAGSAARVKFTNIISKGTATQGVAYMDGCEAVVVNFYDGADADGDDDADLADFALFQECYTGSGATTLGWPCLVFDSMEDDDVDVADYLFFEGGLIGPVP